MAEKPQARSIRQLLRQQLPPEQIVPKMVESIQEALNATKTEWIECKHCHKKTPFAVPNMFERAKAAQLVMEQLEGKVGTHREAPAQARQTVGDFADLSDEDLLALLEKETDDD
jgi:hypothetical protein